MVIDAPIFNADYYEMTKYPHILKRETENYLLSFIYNVHKKQHELHIRSKSKGRYFAVHNRYNLLDRNGTLLASKAITPEVAEFIFKYFEVKGDTESFNIYKSDLAAKQLLTPKTSPSDPELIRHIETKKERSYTATGAKLGYHWPIFQKFGQTGFGSIIRATMTNTQTCSSHCPYCSTILRNRKDSISLEDAKAFIEKLYFLQADFNKKKFAQYNNAYKQQTGSDIRLRGLILSGGGQPNLWPHFSEFTKWLSKLDIDLGLITNGFPRHIDDDVYNHFKWIRISITPEDASLHYKSGRFNRQYFPPTIMHNPRITVGLSYVFGPWTDDDIFLRINAAIEENGFDYCRLLTDCNLTRTSQLHAHRELAERLYRLDFIDDKGNPLKKIFHQLKYHGSSKEAEALWTKGQCFLQIYNTFWDTTGHEENGYSYCYPCDSITVLAEESTAGHVSVSARKFSPQKWGTVGNHEVDKLFMEPMKPFFDPRKLCSSCLFMQNNQTVRDLFERNDYSDMESHSDLDHLNFP